MSFASTSLIRLVKFILKHFILLVVIVNGTFSEFPFSDSSLPVYKMH